MEFTLILMMFLQLRLGGFWAASCIVGYTVNIDLEKIKWAEQAGADYVSFCSIFHQCTANQCPIVSLETVKNVRSLTKLSMFAAGGINLENAHLVLEAGADGIAVTSALIAGRKSREDSGSIQKND